jgi:predicted acyltransferase
MTTHKPHSTPRLLSLDVFRGITIVLMILVNSPGNNTAYPLLNHSAWNGCTLADLAFPFFIFIMGVSLVFSLSKARKLSIPTHTLIMKILKRTIILILIGLFFNAFPNHFDFSMIRVFGVLQRIAICYCVASLLFLTTGARTQALIMSALLIGYWLLMTWVPVPDFGNNNLSPEGNLAAYIDRLMFSSDRLYGKVFDPEGLLSTLPAIATTLLGSLTGYGLLSQHTSSQKKLQYLCLLGFLAIPAGWICGLFFPINKALWTSSFVLWTGGLALLLLAFCYWLIEIEKWKKWSIPFEIFGMNAIAAYFLHIFFLKIQAMIHFTEPDGSSVNLRLFISEHLFGWTSLNNASLLYALSYIMFWLLIFTILYRKKIFIKV